MPEVQARGRAGVRPRTPGLGVGAAAELADEESDHHDRGRRGKRGRDPQHHHVVAEHAAR